jgi:hypothetical protein
MRQLIKRVIERAAVLSGVPVIARMASRARALVLMYHNIVPIGEGTRGESQ